MLDFADLLLESEDRRVDGVDGVVQLPHAAETIPLRETVREPLDLEERLEVVALEGGREPGRLDRSGRIVVEEQDRDREVFIDIHLLIPDIRHDLPEAVARLDGNELAERTVDLLEPVPEEPLHERGILFRQRIVADVPHLVLQRDLLSQEPSERRPQRDARPFRLGLHQLPEDQIGFERFVLERGVREPGDIPRVEESLPSRPAGHLQKLDLRDRRVVVVVHELRKDGGLGRKIHAERQRVRSRDDVENALPESRLDEQLLLGQHASVIDSHAAEQRHLHLRHVEDVGQFVEALALFGRYPPSRTRDPVGQLRGALLRKDEDERVSDAVDDGRRLRTEDEFRHAFEVLADGERTFRHVGEVRADRFRAAERRRHDEHGRIGMRVPEPVDIGPGAVGVGEDVVKLVDDKPLSRKATVLERVDLLRAADDRGALVPFEVPRLDADVEPHAPQVEVPLVGKRLDRRREDDSFPGNGDLSVFLKNSRPEIGDQSLSRSGRGGKHRASSPDPVEGAQLPIVKNHFRSAPSVKVLFFRSMLE